MVQSTDMSLKSVLFSFKVLDEGRLVEFDEPYLLLQKKNSIFTQMVEQTNANAAAGLYEVARRAYKLRHEGPAGQEGEADEETNSDLDDDFEPMDALPGITITGLSNGYPTPSSPNDFEEEDFSAASETVWLMRSETSV